MLLVPLASPKITSGFFTYSKLADTSDSFMDVCLFGFKFVTLALIVVSSPCFSWIPVTSMIY